MPGIDEKNTRNGNLVEKLRNSASLSTLSVSSLDTALLVTR